MKYIIVDQGAILFNDEITHLQIAKNFKEVYSAGFVKFEHGVPIPYGKSESLKIECVDQELDEEILMDAVLGCLSSKYIIAPLKDRYAKCDKHSVKSDMVVATFGSDDEKEVDGIIEQLKMVGYIESLDKKRGVENTLVYTIATTRRLFVMDIFYFGPAISVK